MNEEDRMLIPTAEDLESLGRFFEGPVTAGAGRDEGFELAGPGVPRGKDGEPVFPGQTVYGGDGRAWKVRGLNSGPYAVVARSGDEYRELKPEWLTHERPDTLKSVYTDARNGAIASYGEFELRVKRLFRVAVTRALGGQR